MPICVIPALPSPQITDQFFNFMKFNYLFWCLLALFVACKNEPATLSSEQFSKTEGDCTQACAEFKVRFPKVVVGEKVLQDSVQRWVENVVRNYSVNTEEAPSASLTLEQAASGFIEMWKADQPEVAYSFEVTDTVLQITPDYVALRLNGYMFTGGAHPNSFSELAVFEASTGKRINKKAYIKDEQKILPLLDIAYRAEKKEGFDSGFEYEAGQIAFPEQVAFTEKGVLFHYNTYEIAPYVMGDADIFLTWIDLEGAAKHPYGLKK